ncbi:glutathione S-transferase t2-like protein [Sesbania bispinosa]|nr:glutathione S-transferase t2-like protein [Sesbania bispinosa]
MPFMGNPYAMPSQGGLNYPLPTTSPLGFGGASTRSSGGDCSDQQLQTPAGESQVPSFSSQINLESATDEDRRLGGRTNSKQRYTKEEDTLLIQFWLNISKDPIVGVDKKADGFWSRIKDNYNEHRGHQLERRTNALKSR